MKAVLTWNAPKPAGHYAQAVVHRGVVYISGILPIDPQTDEKKVGSIEEQTKQILENLYSVLIASGSDINMVLKTTVYVADVKLWDQVNKEYAKFFGRHRPARTIVPTQKLHFDYQIEIDAIAAVIE